MSESSTGSRLRGIAEFIAVTALLSFANGRWAIPLVAWLAWMPAVLYVDARDAGRGLRRLFAASWIAHSVCWWKMVPVPGGWYLVVTLAYGAFYSLPFVVHRYAAPHLRGISRTLVLPTAWVAIEWLFQTVVTPYGSWGSLQYTQHASVVARIAVLAGGPGIGFLLVWCGSTLAFTWQGRGSGRVALRPAGTWMATVATALVVSNGPVLFARDGLPTVRAAGILPDASLKHQLADALAAVPDSVVKIGRIPEDVRRASKRYHDDLFARTQSEIDAGARVVVWPETAARLTAAERTAFVGRLTRIARSDSVLMFIGAGIWHPETTPPFENIVITVMPDGTEAGEFHKARPIAGAESGLIHRGAGAPPIVVARGIVATSLICHDLDFPPLVRGALRGETELLVVPASDWKEIGELHARMSIARAIENGVSMLRVAENGLSVATDRYGRVVSRSMDSGGGNFVCEQTPVTGGFTPWRAIGSLPGPFAWAGVLVLCAMAVVSRQRNLSQPVTEERTAA